MRDISSKQITLRTARAIGFLAFSENTFEQVKENKVPKGNIFDYAKAGAFLGAKQTQMVIPHCHPVSIDGLDIQFKLMLPGDSYESFVAKSHGVFFEVTAKSIGRTGIEMEALMAASTCGMTLYDMLKYLGDPTLEMTSVKLWKKTGGKTDKNKHAVQETNVAILQASDAVLSGERPDVLKQKLQEQLAKHNCKVLDYQLVSQEKESLTRVLEEVVETSVPFVIIAGGSGLSANDYTKEVVEQICDREIPGIVEAIYGFGLLRTPDAMLSKLAAGVKGNTIIISIPGSSNGAKEAIEAIFPSVLKAKHTIKKQG